MVPLLAADLSAARSQMAFTLGTHIILSCLGVGFPAIMLVANYIAIKRDDADALRLARRWSKVVAVTFAVGVVTGTVLSFEFGILWPGLFERFGEIIGLPFAVEGIFFFLEAIFITIYLYGWDRVGPRLRFRAGTGAGRNIFERPRDVIDLQVSTKLFNKRLEAKLTVSDLLAQPFSWYYKYDADPAKTGYNTATDRILNSYRYGTTVTLGLRYSFAR